MHWREENREQSYDVLIVNNVTQQVCENVASKLISRSGRSQDKKKKPMKAVIHNQQDKEKIQNSLRNLKVNSEYKGVSVTEDYTVSER